MQRLIIAAICAASFGLLVTSPAFSQQNANRSKRTEASTEGAKPTESAYDWNGFYGGGNGGGGFGGSNFLSAGGGGVPFYEGNFYPGFPQPATPGIIAAYGPHHADKPVVSIGVQAGYNYLMGGVLLGIEADVNYLNVDASKTTSALGGFPAFAGFPGSLVPAVYTFRNKIDANYIASLRPRVGFLVDGVLVYATGGIAMTTLKYQHDFRGTGDTLPSYFTGGAGIEPDIFEHASASRTVAGWTVGGGAELPVLPNVSLRLEYLFTKFANISTSENKIFPLNGASAPDFPCGADTRQVFFGATPTPRQCFSHRANLDLHRIRLGVNFKF